MKPTSGGSMPGLAGNSTLRGFMIGFIFGCILTLTFDSLYFQVISGNWMEQQRQSLIELYPNDLANKQDLTTKLIRPVEDSDDFEANGELLDMVSDVEGNNLDTSTKLSSEIED